MESKKTAKVCSREGYTNWDLHTEESASRCNAEHYQRIAKNDQARYSANFLKKLFCKLRALHPDPDSIKINQNGAPTSPHTQRLPDTPLLHPHPDEPQFQLTIAGTPLSNFDPQSTLSDLKPAADHAAAPMHHDFNAPKCAPTQLSTHVAKSHAQTTTHKADRRILHRPT